MSKKLEKSFLYKALHIGVLMLYNLLLIPALLKFWDLQVYGVWIALYVVFNLIKVFELGHSTYVGNEFNRIVHTEEQEARNILGSAVRANFVVGLLQPLTVWLIYKVGLLSVFLDDNIDQQEVTSVLLILFAYRLTFGALRSLIQKILNPFGLIYKMFQYSILETVVEFCVLVVAAFGEISLVELALLWFAVKAVMSMAIFYDIKRILPQFFPWWQYGNLKTGLKDMKISFNYAVSNFLDRLGNDGIVLLVSAFVGTTYLPLFTATRTIVNFGLKISDFFLTPLAPEMINLYSLAKTALIKNIFRAYWFFSSILLILGFASSLFFIEWLFTLWTNNKLDFSMELYCFLAFIFLVKNYGKVLVVFFTSINKTRVILWTTIMRIVVLYGLTFVLSDRGITAILLAMFLAELVVVTVWLPIFSLRLFKIQGVERLNFFNNLITALLVGAYFYLFINEYYIASVVTIAVALALLFRQYKLISEGLRQNIWDRLRYFSKFIGI
jgi:O-antigen/teichoic acid export membrane protein